MWLQRIKDRGVPLSVYTSAARDWNSCAVSECRKMFPGLVEVTIEKSIPKDRVVTDLGMAFWRAVRTDNRDRAMRIYFRLHARLLRMMRESVRGSA